MLRNKKDVDTHVRELLNKMKNENDRKSRGYNIARLYYSVNEYESARRYLAEFISFRPKASEAHKLMGQIYEKLGQKEKAVSSYKTSYTISQTQKDLVPKICDLYSEVEAEPGVKSHWVEEGERLFPHHNSIIKLRQSMMISNPEQSKEELEKFYLREIKANPLSLSLHVKLSKLLLDWGKEENGKYAEAFEYVIKVEGRRPFPRSLEWYETMVEVLKTYESKMNSNDDKEFEELYLTIFDRYVFESLASSCGPALSAVCSTKEAAKRLKQFDSRLCAALNILGKDSESVKHFVAQYYFHAGILLAVMGKTESILHKDIYMGSLLLQSVYLPNKLKVSFANAERGEILKGHWRTYGHYRVSQTGHLLNQLGRAYRGQKHYLNKILEMCSNDSTRKHIHKLLFSSEDGESMLLTDTNFLKGELKFVDEKVQIVCDQEVSVSYNSELRELVWLYNQYSSGISSCSAVKFLNFHFFRTIPFASSMNTYAPETLCHLDLIAFIVATSFCHQSNSDIYNDVGTSCPSILAVHIHTPEQGEWWSAASALCSNAGSKRLNRLRSILQNGLESIRHLGHHVLPLQLSVHLARYFTNCISEAKEEGNSSTEIESLEERAEHYWSKVVAQCLKSARGSLGPTKSRLFEVRRSDLSENDLMEIGEEGELFIAERLVAKGKREEAIQILFLLKSPKASFNRAMLYKKEAQSILGNRTWHSLNSNSRIEYTDLLTQARDALYLTLDRLKMPGVDPSDPLNSQLADELTSVEHSLANVDDNSDNEFSDTVAGNPNITLNLTNGNASNLNHWAAPSNLALSNSAIYSTPNSSNRINRQEARPSPERLDAQVRHLTEIQQNTIKNIEEHNAALRAQNKALLETCQTMAAEFKENVAFYKSYIEQKNAAADHITPVLDQLQRLQTTMKNLQLDIQSIGLEVKELRRSQTKLEPVQLVTAGTSAPDSQVPLEIASPAIQGVYNNYMGFYGQQPVGSPLVPPTAVFNPCQPPFMPPSTLQDQTYMPSSTTTLIKSESSLSSGLGNATLYQQCNVGLKTSQNKMEKEGTSTGPPHSYQISLPPVSTNIQFPSVPQALPISETTETSFNTEGLLSNVPAPLYSAISSNQSPEKVDPKNLLASSLTSTPVTPKVNLSGSSSSLSASTFGQRPKSTGSFPPGPSLDTSKHSPIKSANDSDHYVDDGHDPYPDFKPIIPLPEQVEVNTGEENERILFEGRAKLFRFVEKEWKERGLGPLKILHNECQNTVRVLMRRDQTHKICCNHLITPLLELTTMKDNDKVWIWAAQDFADEKLTLEKFCCRFKTPESAQDFHKAFYTGKAIAESAEKIKKDVSSVASPKSDSADREVAAEMKPELKPLSEMFKPEEGSWNCPTCLILNRKGVMACLSCQTRKPGEEVPKSPDAGGSLSGSLSDTPKVTFKFGVQNDITTPTSASSTLTFLGDKSGSKSTLSFIGITSSKPTITFGSPSTTSSNIKSTTIFGTNTSLTLGPNSGVTVSAVKPGEAPSLSLFKTGSQSPAAIVASNSGGEQSPASIVSNSKTEPSGKFSVEGFTFSTVPNISSPKSSDKVDSEPLKKPEPKKESIFSNFSFSSSKAPLSNDSKGFFTFNLPSTAKVNGSSSSFEQTSSTQSSGGLVWEKKCNENVATFSALAASDKSEKLVFVTKDPKAFEPKPLFGRAGESDPNKSTGAGNTSKDEVEEYEPQVDFKPVVPMPDLVEIKTGEEDEEKLFCERAKLYRFDNDTKEWKERGVGEVKILRNNSTKKARLLMRRDQTHKVCANHFITPLMKLTPLPSSQNAWVWAANDYADEEMKMEKFAIRFKTSDIAQKFFSSFEESQKTFPSSTTGTEKVDTGNKTDRQSSEKETTAEESNKENTTGKQSLSEIFKPSAGSWECATCLVRNEAENTSCVACSSPKDGLQSEGNSKTASTFGNSSLAFKSMQNETSGSGSFSFGIKSTNTTTTTAASVKSSTTTAPFKFGITNSSSSIFNTPPSSSQPFNFAWNPPTTSEEKDKSKDSKDSTDGQVFSTPSSGDEKANSSFAFGSPGKYEFKFSGVKSSRSRDTSTCESENGAEEEEEEEDKIYFEPVVPLPDKVDVVTGEENETPLFSHRAKLYRLKDGEFKERGLGDVKILEHNENQKIRILMRREQVHKICLNHYISKDLEFREKDEKSFYWVATDFSELEPSKETFAIRFKTPEIAKSFYEALLQAQKKLSMSSDVGPGKLEGKTLVDSSNTSASVTESSSKQQTFGIFGSASASCSNSQTLFSFGDRSSFKAPEEKGQYDSSDVEVTFEKKATPDQLKRAKDLLLPDNFFTYEDTESTCPGCIGCSPDTFKFKPIQKSTDEEKSTFVKPSLFGESKSNIFGANTTLFSASPKLSFGGPAVFSSNSSSTASSFVSTDQTPQQEKLFGTTQSSNNIFGNTPTTNSIFGGSVFSSGSVFGGNTSSVSIFGGVKPTVTTTTTTVTTTTSVFSGLLPKTTTQSIIGNLQTTTSSSTSSIFGGLQTSTTKSSLFGKVTTSSSIFGGGSSSTSSEPFSNQSSNLLTYSELAKQSSQPAFTNTSTRDSSAWVSKPIFSNKSLDKSGGEGDEDFDPHYEPVIPMPELVEVTTGEEGWTELFSNRAKVYRYDADKKEWKERGVGDFKVQYEPKLEKYRLLQRREQVHKLSCNHLLTASLKLDPMSSSETSWCWFATDYSESATGEAMKLAVKFKTKELAMKFKEVVQECQQKLPTQTNTSSAITGSSSIQNSTVHSSSSSSTSVAASSRQDQEDEAEDNVDDVEEDDDDEYEDVSGSDECLDEEEEEEEEAGDDEDDYCGEEEQSLLFCNGGKMYKAEKEGWKVLGSGVLKILYDDEAYGARVIGTTEDGKRIIDHLIAVQTVFNSEDKLSVTWAAFNEVDESVKKTHLKASFDTDEVTTKFLQAFAEGKDFAFSSDIQEAYNEVPEDLLYYGQARED